MDCVAGPDASCLLVVRRPEDVILQKKVKALMDGRRNALLPSVATWCSAPITRPPGLTAWGWRRAAGAGSGGPAMAGRGAPSSALSAERSGAGDSGALSDTVSWLCAPPGTLPAPAARWLCFRGASLASLAEMGAPVPSARAGRAVTWGRRQNWPGRRRRRRMRRWTAT